jgi:[acyl-carrier-protein] S-malonyltransferase
MSQDPIAFLFPGQGSQTVGMAGGLCAALPAARQLFTEASAVLGYDLLDVCVHGPAERLNATDVSQPAIFVASLAALESLRQKEPEAVQGCIATAGLSLGEYTALVFAGALSFRDGLQVVRRRGEAMQAASDARPGAMVSVVGLEAARVEELCRRARAVGLVQVANLLCPGNTVVSGAKAACEELERLAEEAGARTVRLAVAGAFHTPLMKPADDALAAALAAVALAAPRLPVWSNVDARPHTDPEELRGLLVRQVVEPVRWEESLRGLLAAGVTRFYEIGPGRVLTGLLKRVQRKVECRNVAA